MLLAFGAVAYAGRPADDLAKNFASPPPSARPWVYWFWINGNISKLGITADLESLQRVGVGGVLWMEVAGQPWAPAGPVAAHSSAWHEHFQWAIAECARLGLEFNVSADFGYGSGGPHISPERSMQKLVWSEQSIDGGKPISVRLARPAVARNLAALRPGANISASAAQAIERSDSYRDVAVVAIPLPESAAGRSYRIADLGAKAGLLVRKRGGEDPPAASERPMPAGAAAPLERVIDLTAMTDRDGRLTWDAPAGKWLVLRFGHASNFKMTRPSPKDAVGLECDRLSRAGIETHFDAFLKKIVEGAGAAAGRTLAYTHIDSWEAGGQNWTASFPAEFKVRRGYDLRPWLPVLAGRVVGSAEWSERFLWDVRATVGEMIRDNYAGRLKELARAHGMKLSIEAYGRVCIDNLAYAGLSDMPVSEFWVAGDGVFPSPRPLGAGYEQSSKAMASAAHTYGRPIIGAEAFTATGRGWRDHPYLLKPMGDQAFARGVNRLIFHASTHQAYEHMVPGLTHRRNGEHLHRHNTWWNYSRPWMEYLARCQYILQQGHFVADVGCWFGEGAPLNVDDMKLSLPDGYDYDLCSSEIVRQMAVRNGRVVLPSGMSYRYLVLPDADRMTLPLARKVQELVESGARVIGGPRLKGTPGLTGHPGSDQELERIAAALWDTRRVRSGLELAKIFREDGLPPDFEGRGLHYLHRRIDGADAYFVSHPHDKAADIDCTFRVAGKVPELWDPETGETRELPEYSEQAGRITVPLHFEPMQSWFVLFRDNGPASRHPSGARNFAAGKQAGAVKGPWQVSFDGRWGGPRQPVAFTEPADWSTHADPAIHYYSGTAVYKTSFTVPSLVTGHSSLWLDLGAVEVMARVRVNGKDCGIAWKPPYRVDISGAARPGENHLEIDVVNLWINRMIGDEQLPEDGPWLNFETLAAWPDWFKTGRPRPSGRFTFTTCKYYEKDTPLVRSGLLGPVTLQSRVTRRP